MIDEVSLVIILIHDFFCWTRGREYERKKHTQKRYIFDVFIVSIRAFIHINELKQNR